jgi:hypothetical protein
VYEPPEVLRDVLLFATSGALLVAMAYVIYRATRQPPPAVRVSRGLAMRSAT